MADCLTNKFVITKGVDNNFIFTIKADNSTSPINIDSFDTFSAQLVKLSDQSVEVTKNLTIEDSANGKVGLVITETEAASLTSDRGSKADRYYLKPTYKLVIECSTVSNGDFVVKACEVYVD